MLYFFVSVKAATGTLMPMQYQMRKFFESGDVFKTIMAYEQKIKNENKLNHFINGSVWKEKLSALSADRIVIPYHLYLDDTQLNNALGTHCLKGLESCVYYTFPTIPSKYASRLENIFVAMLFSAADDSKFGTNCCFERLVDELNTLATDGIKIVVDGVETVIYFVLGLYLGDNLSLNKSLGFVTFNAKHYCRVCKLEKLQCQTATTEDISMLRTEQNYDDDVKKKNPDETGIKWFSIFNSIFLFHVIHSVGMDVMHDLCEGVLRYNMCEIILHFIRRKKFSLKLLNNRKNNFAYDYNDRGNKSKNITMKNLKKRKLSMSSSEMTTFVHVFSFLVGDLVEPDDEVWKFYLKTMEVLDLVYLRSYTEEDLVKLGHSICEMNEMYKRLFKQTLKPKHHLLTHYPNATKKFGPLRYISSLRFEANHRFVKKYTKNTESRRNISYSLARKLQYGFANNFISTIGPLKDKLEYKSKNSLILSNADFYGEIDNPEQFFEGDKELFETETLTMNGIFFFKRTVHSDYE